MTLRDDLTSEVADIFRWRWTERNGEVVPESEDVGLDNDAVKLAGTVLYADLAESTKLVDSKSPTFAAEIYKAFLRCAAKIVIAEGGVITAYDGDRIMAVFIGSAMCTSAARAALKINHATCEIINPAIKVQYPSERYELRQVVGVDTSDLFVARTGVRGSNDLVWVGRAANHAAKLSALPAKYTTYITRRVHERLHGSVRTTNGNPMWTELTWGNMGGMTIYGSAWHWPL